MSGHLLLFGSDIIKPTPAVHAGNGEPYGEIQFPAGVITYRDPADIDELIAAAAALRVLLAEALAQEPSLPGLGAQGEPATGERGSEANTGQGHTHDDCESTLTDLPCGCQDMVYACGYVDREHDHVICDGTPLPLLPQRVPAGPPAYPKDDAGHAATSSTPAAGSSAAEARPDDVPRSHAAGDYAQLDPEALAGGVPLESLAPEPQEDEAQG